MPCFGQLWCIQMCRGLQGSSAGRVCQKMCKWRGFLQMLCKVCEHPFLCFWPGFQTVSQHLKSGLGGEGTLNPPPPPNPTAYFFSDSQVTRLCYSKYFEFCFHFQNIIIRNTMFCKINKEVCQYSCPNGIYNIFRRDKMDCHKCRFCCSLLICATNTSQGILFTLKKAHRSHIYFLNNHR